MKDTRYYDADFYRGEIESAELQLSQSVDAENRKQLLARISTAKQYLADITTVK